DGPGAYTASTEDISGLEPGLYILSTTTAEFCLFVDSFLVSENDSIIADLVTSPSVCGTNSGSASLTVTGGEVAVDYTYSFFSLPDGTVISTFSSVGSLDGGLYGYTVTDDNGCQTSGTFTISDDFGTLDAVVQGVTCEGEDDGSIELTVTGLTGMTTISWVGPGSYTSSDEDIFDLEAGIYTVTITDENGCVLGDTYEVDEGVGILITGTVTDILCFEDDNGAIDMEFSGGQTPYDISWIGPGTFTAAQEDINDLEPGDYSVTITDLNGCNGTADFTVTEPELLDVEAFINPLVCNGDFSGAIEINILGGTGPYDINWVGPNPYTSTFEDISGLEAGTYSLSISDDNSCAFSADYDVLQPDALVITLLQLVNSSCDLDIGLLEVEASGGNSPYQFTWTNSSGFEVSDQALADDLSADTYTVIIEDEDGCTNTEDYIISNQEAFLDGVVDSVSCNGLSDGSIDLEVTGTITGNADTLWTGPGGFTATSEDIAGLLAGDYTVTIEDDASCVFTETFTVFEPDTILVSGTSEPVNCSGLTDGAIYIDVVGGVGGYEYSWTGPSTFTSSDEDLSDLEPGIYNLTVSDIIPCSVDFSIEVLEPDSILISQDTLIDPSCVGLGDGVISITVTGGNGGYDYDWSGSGFSSTQEDLTNLGPGVYDLTVTDDSSCTQMSSFELTNVQVLDIAATTTDLVCFGVDQGEIDLTVTGGNGTYTFDWVGPIPFTSSDEDINGLAAGAYDILVTDSIGCQRDSIFTIDQPDSIEVAVIGLENVSCAGFSDGSIDIEVSGGVPDYTYSWWGPAAFSDIDQDIFDLVSGTYIVSVTDLNDCIMIDSVSVMQPDSIELSGIVEPVNCNGDENGSISIDASGGSGIYDYEWVGPGPFMSDDEDISNLAPGIYTVTVSDDVPCVAEFSFEVLEPDSILIDEDGLIDPTCSGLSDGAIAITVQGGNGGYEYQWNGPGFNSTLEDINNLGPGDYNITVTDDSMCVETASFTLNDIQVMDLDVDIDSIACFGDDGAAIDITVSGGNGGFGFEWTGPSPFSSVDEDIADLIPGDYTLLITDALGCELDSIINIFEPDSLIIANVDNVQATCNGFDDGAIFLDIEGGMAEFSYSWIGPGSFTADTEDITDLIAGQYTLTVTDANDCVATQDINVDEPLPLNLTLDVINDAECENTLDGNIFITVTGGNSGYIYDWMGPNAFDSNEEDIIGVLPGDYILNVSDQFGCIISDAYLIDFEVAISVDAGDYGPVCNGEELILSGQGGPPGSDFSWSTPQGPDFSSELTASVQISPSNDVFILTATNGNCIASDTTTIEVLATPTPDAGEDVEVFLDDLVILGGDPTWIDAQSYSWSPSLNLDDPSSSNPTYQAVGEQLFTLIVIGANGCIGIDEVLITINPSLDIPSGFTPNGDNRNETWIIQNTELFPEMIVRIFNRWGDELWTSGIGYPQEWDGKYEESILPVGTYYYVIELNDSRFPDALTGPITIFR
ncbi:MAG: T9SS type B sorting domain-containing protein, partial [Flavobacteriales bacterium]|nr:T9SS type B sorting domain-containing protein [Flavobacteriales bacterium]